MLRRAGIKVTVCSLENELVTCAKHVVIKSDIILPKLDNPKQFDALILPGGIKGATFMKESPAAKNLVRQYYNANKWLGVICAAPIVLLEAKIALEKRITSHPSNAKALESSYDYRPLERVVVDEQLISSQGPGTAIEFALQIVESMMGVEAKDKVAEPLICKP